MRSTLAWHLKYIHAEVERTFQCDKCDHITTTEDALGQHMESSHGNGVSFDCNECSFVAVSKGHLKVHIKATHAAKKHFKCSICDFVTERGGDLSFHIKNVHRGKMDSAVKFHMWSYVTKEKEGKSDDHKHDTMVNDVQGGSKSFESSDDHMVAQVKSEQEDASTLKTEEEAENEDMGDQQLIKCIICGYTAPSQAALTWHTKNSHSNPKSIHQFDKSKILDMTEQIGFKHPFNMSSTGKKTNLFNHGKVTHETQRIFKCWMCDFSACEKGELSNHIRLHHAFKS